MIDLIKKGQTQYKANLHSHSTYSDGRRTPQQLKEMYRKNGYSILAITDHEVPYSHFALSEPDFLMLTGYECYIRPDPLAVYDPYEPEVHLNLFAKDPHNETMICYNPNYSKYILRYRTLENLKRAGSERTREYSRAYVQEYIDTALANGYLVAYNHPCWSMVSEADILAYRGCFSMEITNGGAHHASRMEYNAAIYDKMLLAGKHIFCHAGDDNHNVYPDGTAASDSFLAYTYVMSEDLRYDSVIKALEKGEFYASRGPVIHALSVDGRKVHLECSPVKQVCVYTGSKAPVTIHAEAGEYFTSADIEVDERAKYVRVSVFDEAQNSADTRGYFPEELGW